MGDVNAVAPRRSILRRVSSRALIIEAFSELACSQPPVTSLRCIYPSGVWLSRTGIAVCCACRDGPCYRRTAEKVNSRRLILSTETLNSSCAGRSASLRALTPVHSPRRRAYTPFRYGLMDAPERAYDPRIHLFAKKDGLPDQVRQ